VPKSYHLYQNYPNPFNPTTTFELSIPELSYVNLEVFNLLEEKVATLVSEELSAGNYRYEWNAKQPSSGIYYYNLTARGFTKTKKLILLKGYILGRLNLCIL
jgi:hypothetical protein